MKKLNVIDLDMTLIPFDSFRLLVKRELKALNIYLWLLTGLRVFRLINADYYKKKIFQNLRKYKKEKNLIDFAGTVYESIDPNVIELIIKETDQKTINVLLSASPQLYVKHIIKKLGWKGCGSYLNEEGKFIHLYGNNKIKWLDEVYGANKYEYNFAISDSHSDDQLLSMFKKSVKWKY